MKILYIDLEESGAENTAVNEALGNLLKVVKDLETKKQPGFCMGELMHL